MVVRTTPGVRGRSTSRSLSTRHLDHALQRPLEYRTRSGMQGRLHQQSAQVQLKHRQRVVARNGTQDIQRHDVAGALPDRAQVRIAQQTGVAPLFDVAAAAAHFHRVAGDAPCIAAGAKLDQRRQDARQCRRAGLASIGAPQCLGGLKEHAARLLGGQQQLQQLPAHQGQVNQAAAKGLAFTRHKEGLAASPSHQPGGAHAVGQTRVVDHVGHQLKAAPWLAHQPG